MSEAERGRGNAARGFRCATWLKRDQSAATSKQVCRCSLLFVVGQRVLNERVLLHRWPDDAGRDLDRGHEVRWARHRGVGRSGLGVDLFAATALPGPGLSSDHQDHLGLAAPDGEEGLVDDLLLRDAELVTVRPGPFGPDAGRDGPGRIGQRPGSLGQRHAVHLAEERRATGIVGGRQDRLEHQVGDGHARRGRGDADQDRCARGGAARRRIHDWRCYGPPMAKSDTARWEAALDGFTKESFEADGKRRDIYRAGHGPAVIIISEMPGITPLVAEFGRKVVAAGCTAVMPHIFGDPGDRPQASTCSQSLGPACISPEFAAFALKKTSPITVWLRKLAAAEHERCGGPGVGAVGMCFTGGFALAMMVDDIVLAPVLSQPSLPLPLNQKHKADIGISDADLARVKERTAAGTCLLGLRFSNDPFCFEERFATLRRELGDAFIAVEIDSSPGNPHGHPKNAHSVLTEHLQDREGTPTRAALDQTLTFFREKLGVGTGPGPEAGPGE